MTATNDPMIDEIRSIRRECIANSGGDLDRLADHLRTIEKAWRERSGQFAGVPASPGEEMFPDKVARGTDAIMEEVRNVRKDIAGKAS